MTDAKIAAAQTRTSVNEGVGRGWPLKGHPSPGFGYHLLCPPLSLLTYATKPASYSWLWRREPHFPAQGRTLFFFFFTLPKIGRLLGSVSQWHTIIQRPDTESRCEGPTATAAAVNERTAPSKQQLSGFGGGGVSVLDEIWTPELSWSTVEQSWFKTISALLISPDQLVTLGSTTEIPLNAH